MSKSRFDKAFADFVRRGDTRMTAKTFFQVLREIEQERTSHTIELRARVVNGRLQFEPSPQVDVEGNAILLGNHRIVVTVS